MRRSVRCWVLLWLECAQVQRTDHTPGRAPWDPTALQCAPASGTIWPKTTLECLQRTLCLSLRWAKVRCTSKGVTDFGHLRMHGNLLSKSTKLRALCFLKLFLLVLMVWSENSRGHVWGQSFVLHELYSSRIFAKPFRDGSTMQWTGYQLTQQRKSQYMRTTKTVRESNSWEEI